MSLPHLLLVDDSEAVLAFERAALGGHYTLSTATNGADALERIARLRPAAVLLDLSMPQMDGDEVLARLQADPELRRIPVIIVSSERRRAEACVRAGAKAFVSKPLRAKELLPAVSRALEAVRLQEREGNVATLFVGVADLEVGLPLDCVESVIDQVATRTLAGAPAYACEVAQIHGQPLFVLDLAARLGVAHAAGVDARKLVVVGQGPVRFTLCVDRVSDPAEISAADLAPAERVGSAFAALRDAVVGAAETARGAVPIVSPDKLLTARDRETIPLLLARSSSAAEAP